MKQALNVRIDESLREKLKEQAKRENRTVSNLVDTILRDYLKRAETKR